MEKWDLYNAKREKSGITVCRGEIIPKGLYHLSVSVWIVNQQGQYLLSQRHPKKQYPLYWECTGGSVLSGETSLQGAIREVKEELGILLTPGSEKLIYQSRRENVQDFYDVWLFHKDIKIEEMRLQETEVVDVQWVNPDKLFEMFRLKLSNLVAIHQKTGIGRLSAYCGAVSAGAAAGAGIAYLCGGGYEEVIHTVVNALAIVSGMVCDGAKASCAAKIASSVDAGILGYNMYLRGQQFYAGDGIVTKGVEATIQNIGRLGKDGMKETNEEIIKMMISD